jgi:hypothetical protein
MKSTCVEYFGSDGARWGARADGVCGRQATHVAWDSCSGTWGPKCPRCARFYAGKLVKPITVELDARIAALQAGAS